MKHAGRAALALMMITTALGCSGKNDSISAAARQQLQRIVHQVRNAAAEHDPVRAQHALKQLRGVVAAFENAGDISSVRATQILSDATLVQARLDLVTTTTATPPTTAPPPPPGPDNGHGKGHNHHGDNGNDNGNNNGNN